MASYIVCVDDQQSVLNQLSEQLSRRFGDDYRIECAQSAEEALGLIEEIHGSGDTVHLVVCDQVMPGMKGDRFLEVVNQRWPEVTKILLTGEAGLESAIYAINHAGLHRYIEKPWQPEDLFLSVSNLLTQYGLRQEAAASHVRLERKARQLHSLYEVGIELSGTEDAAHAMALAQEAARRILGVESVAAVAQMGRDPQPQWRGLPCPGLTDEGKDVIEKTLASCRAELGPATPPLPFAGRAVPLRHGTALYGWLLLMPAPEPLPENDDLLAILAGQTAAALHNIELLAARLETDRLTTIGRMLSSIVHDFRNPMTLVKGYGSILADGSLPPERRNQFSNLIVQEADRISAMIEELLDYTRGRRTPLRPTLIGVPELMQHLEGWISDELRTRGITLAKRLDYDGPIVVDIDRMKRALLNVATNAMDAMEEGGTLTVESRASNGTIELALSDTGHGIPQDVQNRVFEPFFTHGKRHGLGLGMTIMRKIVEEHGGQVDIRSAPGQGTRLALRFPQTIAPPAV
jgi:two-component system chemotaxis response regulator CheY